MTFEVVVKYKGFSGATDNKLKALADKFHCEEVFDMGVNHQFKERQFVFEFGNNKNAADFLYKIETDLNLKKINCLAHMKK